MIPSKFLQLDRNERAFIVAAIQLKTEEEKKKQKKINSAKKR